MKQEDKSNKSKLLVENSCISCERVVLLPVLPGIRYLAGSVLHDDCEAARKMEERE